MSLNNFDSLPILTGAPNGLAPVYVLIPQSGNLVVTWLLRMRRGVLPLCHACPSGPTWYYIGPCGTTLMFSCFSPALLHAFRYVLRHIYSFNTIR